VAFLSFFRHVAGLDLPEYYKWQHYEAAAIHGGPRFMHRKFWIVSDFPTSIRRDAEHRPHCETGPSLAWRDGWTAYYWRGVAVPGDWVLRRESLDPATALTWPNVEQRRAAAEIVGWARVLESLSPRVIDTDPDPEIGTLMHVDLPDAPGSAFLRVRCGTKREFCLPVPAELTTALAANAWTYSLDANELTELEGRT
jgi:hypothetical protein